jgi:sodium transport system permease protein
MNLSAIVTVFRKEILDILRDRRTVIFMVLLPLLLMPAIFTMIKNFTISNEKTKATTSSRVAIVGYADAPELTRFLSDELKAKYEPKGDEEIDVFMIASRSEANAFLEVRTDIASVEEAQKLIRSEELDAALIIPPGFENQLKPEADTEGKKQFTSDLNLRIDYISTEDFSDNAYDRLRNSLKVYRERVVAGRLNEAGFNEAIIEPWKLGRGDMATKQEIGGKLFGSLIPYFLILMTFTGAVFPAISLGAGEKEQKTLESLLASPVGRMEMVIGKFLTIVVTGIISAVLAMTGMVYGFNQLGSGEGIRDMLELQLDSTSIVMALSLLLPLSFVFAGVLLSLSVFAKSYREAQSYIGPLQVFVIFPAFLSMLPGIEINYVLSLIPVANVSLVLQKILGGKAMEVLPYYGVTLASTIVFAGIAIWFCTHMFQKENAIFKV